MSDPTLNVYLNNRHIANLWLESKYYFFQYITADTQPISLSLPVREEPYANDHAKAYFANLLPEGEVRSLVETRLGVSRGDDFELLKRIGGDCAGAVTLFPEGEAPSANAMYTELSEEGLNDLIKSLPTNPLCIGMGSSVRLSLAGAQNKTTLFRQDGVYYVPINGAPSSHILKAPITNIEGIVDTVHNETFIMMLAKVVGLNVPRVEMVMIGGIPVFVIDRYDRMADNSGVMQRLLQEDFCQLLMYEPTVKYQHSGGPTIEDCATKIREHSSDFITDIEQLLKWVAFNIVIGNADAHGKNLSMLWGSDGIRLAPFYDMLSTGIYGKYHDAGYAMSIGRQFDANKLERGDWKTLAEYLDINIRLLDQINKEMLDIIRPAAHSTAERFKETYGDNRTVDKIVAEIEMRAVMLKRAVQD